MPQLKDSRSLQSHVHHLRYALATTACGATVDVLRKMLGEAEARLQHLNACNSKPL